MRNSILLIILSLIFSFNLTGCSLFSSDGEEQENATVAEEGTEAGAEGEDSLEGDTDEFEDGEFDAEAMAKDEGDEESLEDLASDDVEAEDNFGDEYPDDDYGAKASTQASADDDFIDDNSFADASDTEEGDLFADEGGALPDDTMASNEEADLFAANEMEPVVDTPTYDDSSFDSMGDYAEPKAFVPVKKMKAATYKRAGANINRLYIVRQGDNMDSIAEKIYGNSSKAEDLYSYNSHFRGKTVNVGDKIYYSSPNSPNDSSMKTYYEDNNIAPQYYSSQDGDNIRKVAKKLLGHDRSWMEIYATNPNLDSKNTITGGLQLRYWPDGSAPAPSMAMNEPAQTPPPAMEEPEEMPVEEPMEEVAANEPEEMTEPDMEATDVAQIEEPPAFEDDMDEVTPPPAAGSVAPPPPPKPVAPPPPPPAVRPNFNKPKPPRVAVDVGGGADNALGLDEDSKTMAVLGFLMLLACAIVIVFIRRNRSKKVNFSQTQV